MDSSCDKSLLRSILENSHTIAVVGLSQDPNAVSYHVCSYLMNVGYRIIPVRPDGEQIMGEKIYRTLKDIEEPVDIVYIFRNSSTVQPFVEEAMKLKPKAIWLPLGVSSEEAEHTAEASNVICIMNTCMKAVHERLRLDHEI